MDRRPAATAAQLHVVLGRLVETAALYGREPLAPRAACRKRLAGRPGARGWEPGDELTTRAERAERTQRVRSKRMARLLAAEAACEAKLTVARAAELTGTPVSTLEKAVRSGRLGAAVRGRNGIVSKAALVSYFRRGLGLA